MIYKVSRSNRKITGSFTLPASKSESNRALIIRQFCIPPFTISNLSGSNDTQTLMNILDQDRAYTSGEVSYDVGAAGTTMRFLIAYFSITKGMRILKGSERMHKRPVKILVEALLSLGAKIDYLGEKGYPPLRITGTDIKGGEIEIDGSVSSQYISALLMIAPSLPLGMVIRFTGDLASWPYINMTLKLMEHFGVSGLWHENSISVSPQRFTVLSDEEKSGSYPIEADWSAASYWYAIAAFADEADITLHGLKKDSLQGDSILPHLFHFFGVKTEFLPGEGIRLTRIPVNADRFGFDFIDCPDIAQTIAVVASALGIPTLSKGLQTLRIKETDRAEALRTELKKFGIDFKVQSDDAALFTETKGISNSVSTPVDTHDDHRMAMAFATLAMRTGCVYIKHPDVVSKSYPGFWDDMMNMGFKVEKA